MKKFIILLILMMGIASISHAHSGRTNSEGCHNQTSNNTYHCHR